MLGELFRPSSKIFGNSGIFFNPCTVNGAAIAEAGGGIFFPMSTAEEGVRVITLAHPKDGKAVLQLLNGCGCSIVDVNLGETQLVSIRGSRGDIFFRIIHDPIA